MNFLFPGFLFALSAIAIPVVIHLFNFRKFKKVYFSNVAFLKEIIQQTSSRQKIKNLLLLITRMLAILFLVLAFSKPYLSGDEATQNNQQLCISIYLDNSYSMEVMNKEGMLLAEAKQKAKEIVATLSPNSRFHLVTNDFEGKHQRLLSPKEFINAIEEVKISSATRNLRQIINRQKDILLTQNDSKKIIYLISDFQKNMIPKEPVKSLKNISVKFIPLSTYKTANVSIDSVWFISPTHKPNSVEQLVVQLKNNSDEQVKDISVRLSVNGIQRAIGNMSINKRSVERDTLSFSGLTKGWQQGVVDITDHPITFDNQFFFSFYTRDKLPVLVINNQNPDIHLTAVYQADSFFSLTQTNVSNINYATLNSYSFIILNSINALPSGLSHQLENYVKTGGSLLIFPSLSDDLVGFAQFLQHIGADTPEGISTIEAKVTRIHLQHPVFNAVFDQNPKNIDLPVAQKYVKYSNRNRTNRQQLLTLAGGGSFLSQYQLHKGKVYLFAVPLNAEAGNIAQHALFIPIMYQSAFLSLNDKRLFYTIGKDDYIETNAITLAQNEILKLKKKDFEIIPDLRQTENFTRLYIADQIKESGNYQLIKGKNMLSVVAFNNNRLESDMSYVDKNELKNLLPDQSAEIITSDNHNLSQSIKTGGNSFPLWKICIMLSLLFLGIEILIIRFYHHKTIPAA